MIDPGSQLLLVKMAAAAGLVVSCSLLAERSGPLVAALIATLPISMGPVFVFLALEHDSAFIAASALGTMISNLTHASFILAYVLLAQRWSTVASLGLSLVLWCGVLTLLRALALPVVPMAVLTVLAYLCVHHFVRPYLTARPKIPLSPPWFAIPLRAACVALLAGGITLLSTRLGPSWSGILAGLPVVLSSLIVILQPRIGGPATAAIMAYGALGLLGVGLALAVVHVTAVPLGKWPALGIGLVLSIVWNLALAGFSKRTAP